MQRLCDVCMSLLHQTLQRGSTTSILGSSNLERMQPQCPVEHAMLAIHIVSAYGVI